MKNDANKRSSRRVAMLGAGYISKFHIEAVRALGDVELAAICDLSQDKADGLARRYGVPKVYASLETMLAEETLDAVHVLLPPPLHMPSVLLILEAGVDVLTEKPLGVTSDECKKMQARAKELGRTLGISHNFLYSPSYEQFHKDYKAGRFGRIDQLDIVWNKELGQLKGGPFGGWLFAKPENVLFEVGPHSFVHLAHLLGELGNLTVLPFDKIKLPRGGDFYRRWEVLGGTGGTAVRMRFAFIDGFTQHYIQVRGTSAVATVDFEQGTYLCTEHTAQVLDVDRYAAATHQAASSVMQATNTLGRLLLSKMRMVNEGAPFERSITRCVRSFYAGLDQDALDERISPALATRALEIAERVASTAKLGLTDKPAIVPAAASAGKGRHALVAGAASDVLVLGGTGFIGQALVRKLCEAGRSVRLVVRDPTAVASELKQLGIDIVKGDLEDSASLDKALSDIKYVYHLARGNGDTWEDYVRTDVEPTRKLAELCLAHGIQRLFYTSSVAIYYAGKLADTITEETSPHPGVLRANIYARAKVEIEKILLEMQKSRGLPVVLFRPGIVLGPGGNPLHWGIAAWPFSSVPRLYGDGNSPLPIVLVDDCADAMVRALDVPGIEGESFNLVGEPCLTAQQYLDELEGVAGVKFRRVPTSSMRYFVEDVGKYLMKTVARDPARKLPSWANWDGRSCSARFDNSRAQQKLGWTPTKDRERIIREGVAVPASQFLS